MDNNDKVRSPTKASGDSTNRFMFVAGHAAFDQPTPPTSVGGHSTLLDPSEFLVADDIPGYSSERLDP